MKNCGRDPKQLCALIESICDLYQVYILNILFKPRVISVIQMEANTDAKIGTKYSIAKPQANLNFMYVVSDV